MEKRTQMRRQNDDDDDLFIGVSADKEQKQKDR